MLDMCMQPVCSTPRVHMLDIGVYSSLFNYKSSHAGYLYVYQSVQLLELTCWICGCKPVCSTARKDMLDMCM